MKEFLGILAVILTFLSYIPYVRDILRHKTHPHIYSWFLWGLLTIIVFALQISHHAGPGAFVTLAAGLMCLVVLLLSIKIGKKDIAFSDTLVLIATLGAIGLWLIAKEPVLSVILATTADVMAFIPTIRKSWNKPHTETLSLYVTNVLRFVLALFALQQYTLITTLYPATWLIANGLFALLLILRRRQLI